MKRQRTASAAFVSWPNTTRRAHEFIWIGDAVGEERVMSAGQSLAIERGSPIFDSIQKMYATAELNPYEREVLYGYPYVIGRIDGRPIRAPLLTMGVRIVADRHRLVVELDDDVARFNTLPFGSETNSQARQQSLDRLIQATPALPLRISDLTDFVSELQREIPELQIHKGLTGKLGAPPSVPNSGAFMELIEQAAL